MILNIKVLNKTNMAKRTKIEREADLVVIADLYKRSWTFRQIAEELTKRRSYSLSYVMVKHDLDLVLSRWKEKQSAYIENFVVLQVQQIQAMKQECWSEYLRSKNPSKKIVEKRQAIVNAGIHKIKNPEDLHDLELDYIFDDNTSALEEAKKNNQSLDEVEIHFTDLSPYSGVEVDQTVQINDRLGNPKYLELMAKLMDQEARLLGFYNTDNVTPTTSVVIVKMPEPMSKESFIPDAQNQGDYAEE